jgi:hypothetical protein
MTTVATPAKNGGRVNMVAQKTPVTTEISVGKDKPKTGVIQGPWSGTSASRGALPT